MRTWDHSWQISRVIMGKRICKLFVEYVGFGFRVYVRDPVVHSGTTSDYSHLFLLMNDQNLFELGRHRISRSRICCKGTAIFVGRAISGDYIWESVYIVCMRVAFVLICL